MEFEAVIGLEVHCQLSTRSKIFCSCPVGVEGKSVGDLVPNQNTCPVCAGHPGTLPVLNKRAVEFAIKAGAATQCRINPRSVFARKNYFYPDLPKGYQISQLEVPICESGWLEIESSEGPKKIRIRRIHLEEDAGKNIHMPGFTLVDLNRAGVPLIEIVSEPDLKSAQEASQYLKALYSIVTCIGICDGNMQEGNFRFDANISLRSRGTEELGVRTEVKNVNSFRFVEKAIEYEVARQAEVLRSGGKILQETRGFDSSRNITFSMRSKEEAQDYRYFPDPDILPLVISQQWVEEIRTSLPELPRQRQKRYVQDYALKREDAEMISSSNPYVSFYEEVLVELQKQGSNSSALAQSVANWLCGEITRMSHETETTLAECRLKPHHLTSLVQMLHRNILSSTGAKQALSRAWNSGESIEAIVEQEALAQDSDLNTLEVLVEKMLTRFPSQAAEFKAGKDKLIGFFVGQIMKETAGKANPSLLNEILMKKRNVP